MTNTINITAHTMATSLDTNMQTGNIYNFTVTDPLSRYLQIPFRQFTWWIRSDVGIWSDFFLESEEELQQYYAYFKNHGDVIFSTVKVSPRFAPTYEVAYNTTPENPEELAMTITDTKQLHYKVYPLSIKNKYTGETNPWAEEIKNFPKVCDVAWGFQNVRYIFTKEHEIISPEFFDPSKPLVFCMMYNEDFTFELIDPKKPVEFDGTFLPPTTRQKIVSFGRDKNEGCYQAYL